MNRQEVIALVALASSSYPSMQSREPKPIVEAWSLMLADLDFSLAKAAVIRVCRESAFFPSVAQIVEAAEDLDPCREKLPTVAEAWEEVNRLMHEYGIYRCPVYSCELVKRAVRAIGWDKLCMGENPDATRAHFFRLYESMRNRWHQEQENKKVLELSGMGEVLRLLAGKIGKEDEKK